MNSLPPLPVTCPTPGTTIATSFSPSGGTAEAVVCGFFVSVTTTPASVVGGVSETVLPWTSSVPTR